MGFAWLLPYAAGTLSALLGAYLADRFARRRETEARRYAALRDRYDRGQKTIREWVLATDDLNIFADKAVHDDDDIGELYGRLAELFGASFASSAINFVDKDDSLKLRGACYDAMLERQETLASELGLPAAHDLSEARDRLMDARVEEERLRKEKRERGRKRVQAPLPAEALTDPREGDVPEQAEAEHTLESAAKEDETK